MSSIPASVRTAVWKSFNGENYKAPCYCCNITECSVDSWHAGHIVSRVLGGPATLQNLRPICAQCNTSMGSMHMAEYALGHGLKGRIVNEPRLSLQQLPAVETKSQVACRGCAKLRTPAYLSKCNGYCETCFLVILSLPKEMLTLRVPTGEERELVHCVFCAKANAVVRS